MGVTAAFPCAAADHPTFDTNGDGQVTMSECEVAMAQMCGEGGCMPSCAGPSSTDMGPPPAGGDFPEPPMGGAPPMGGGGGGPNPPPGNPPPGNPPMRGGGGGPNPPPGNP